MKKTVKKAILSGASRGIGRGIALALAENGYDLAVSYFDPTEEYVNSLVKEVEKLGRKCVYFKADFRETGTAEAFARDAIKALGGVDLLVNSGLHLTMGGSILDVDSDELEGMLHSFLRANTLITREIARYMVKYKVKGNIVNVSSGRAERAMPAAGLYSAFKAALNMMTKSFSLDLAPYQIRVNAVSPGYIQVRTWEELEEQGLTPEQIEDRKELVGKVPLGRMGSTREVGEAVVFLASEEKAGYITGANIVIDGGLFLPGMPEERPEPGAEYRGWTYHKPRTGEEWEI